MSDQHSRTKMVIGEDAVDKLKSASVIVFGIGGVGSYVVEGLARAGIGRLVLVDYDQPSLPRSFVFLQGGKSEKDVIQ